MKNRFLGATILILASACTHSTPRAPSSDTTVIETVEHPQLRVNFRAGYSPEVGSLKGCVIYLEGLADSVRNHRPFFSHLNKAGYRVIFFDYMGQGGSGGSMNNTRIVSELPSNATKEMIRRHETSDKFYEIPEQADFFWSRYAGVKNESGQACPSKKFVIGWSTGGLAAYRMAHEKRASAVVLIAPGIHPKMMVGESKGRWDKMLMFRQVITEQTLTRNKFEGKANPHVDPVRPTSPSHVPFFAGNLLFVSGHAQKWKIPEDVAGLVFLSGKEDSYVKLESTAATLKANAPHFFQQTYNGALHELDNETDDVSSDLYARTVDFFDAAVGQPN